MKPDAMQYLEGRGYVRDERIWRQGILEQLRPLIPTVGHVDEVDEAAALVLHLREQVLGSSNDEEIDKELNYLVGDLLSTAPEGRMQKALENGYVLCSVRVERVLVEGADPVSKSARFISSDPDVVEKYSSAPAIDRAVKATARASNVIEMTGRRIPLLASRRPVLARKAQEQLALAMPLDES